MIDDCRSSRCVDGQSMTFIACNLQCSEDERLVEPTGGECCYCVPCKYFGKLVPYIGLYEIYECFISFSI